MKKIIVVILCSVSLVVIQAQTRLVDILNGKVGKLLITTEFKQYIVPHLTVENAMKESSVSTITPRSIILDKDSLVMTMLKNRSIRVVNLQTMVVPLSKGFVDSAYNTIVLKKDVPTMALVTVPNGNETYTLVYVQIFFSQIKKSWAVHAQVVEPSDVLLKGTSILTY